MMFAARWRRRGVNDGLRQSLLRAGPTPTPAVTAAPAVQRVEVRFAGGAVVGGAPSPRVPLGSTVELAVTGDLADEIHLHGYNKTAQVAAGKTATLTFVADTPGTFEVELENRGAKLVEIQVR
jgi:hypothetical protein